MFTKKSHADVKKSTLKIQDYKKDSATRLRHLKTILDFVDLDEAKSVFETNYSHVYYILYDTFVQAEANLKQRELPFHIVHKAHKEELEGSLWLLGKILCLLPELLARRWQCHSLSLIIGKLLHPGNSAKLRKEGVKYFLLWYQALGRNAPPYVHSMFSELVPGLIIPQKGLSGPSSEVEFNTPDFLSHPNMKGELGGSVFHDNCVHPVQCGEKGPLLPPSSNERSAPDPRDGLDILLTSMVHTTACLKWREQSTQRHMKCFEFLLERFKEVYLTVFCPHFDIRTSIYEPKLDLPLIRTTSKKDEVMSSCIVVLINWLSRFTHEKLLNSRLEHVQIEEEEYSTLLANPRFMAYAQGIIVRDVLYMSRENVNFVHEVYRQAFLLGFSTKSQIEAIRTCIAVYRDWMTGQPPPPFLLEPTEEFINRKSTENGTAVNQRLRTDSYLGAISKENYSVRAGLQNVLQVFVTNASNVFLINTAHLNIVFPSKSRDYRSSPLNEQTDICKKVLNVYRTMVMNTRMEPRTWEQLLLVLLQITSVILSQPPQSKSASLGGRLGQAIFQTLIVTWIRAHTNVPVSPQLWDKFLGVLTNLTYRDELIIEWDKTMQTLTRVLARYVYNLNLQDLPLDRLAESKGKRRRFGSVWQSTGNSRDARTVAADNRKPDEDSQIRDENSAGVPSLQSQHSVPGRSAPGTPALNRSYSEGSLASTVMHGNRKNRLHKHRMKHSSKVPTLSSSVEHSLNLILAQNNSETDFSVSVETLSTNKESQSCVRKSTLENRRETFRRAMSLDSLHIKKTANCENELNVDDENESVHGSRSPSPTASSGIEGGSIKDSPIQIDCLAVDNSSVDTQEDIGNSLDRRSIISGGTATGWLPDSAAIMWKRMLGSLGDVNKIPKSELHAQVFKHLVDMTINLIKIKQNQGISHDNQSTPAPPSLVPPIGIVSPWCYGALKLDSQFKKGKLWAVQLLCMLVVNGSITTISQLSLFYNVLHKLLTGEDRDMIYVILKYLEGPRFLSILLPGHTLLYLDIVHASAILLTSFETGRHTPRAEVASLLGSLLCYPASVIPKPVLQPSEKIELMECPDLQNHVLNIILRCARREPSSKARCIALAQLGQWILQKLSGPLLTKKGFLQNIPHKANSPVRESRHFNPRIKEVVLVLLQALQFKHRTIAIAACNSLKICAERAKELAYIERLPHLIIKAICKALEIQNVSNPKEADKTVITSLILCLGEFCMAFPSDLLTQSTDENDDILILTVLKTLHVIASGSRNDRIKLLTADEDFDMTILCDDVDNEFKSSTEANYQTTETIQNCVQAIRLCAKGVAMHLFTHLGHFPMGIGASRLSSMVEEQDDVQLNLLQMTTNVTLQEERRDSVDLGAPQVLNAQNIQIFMLNNGLVSSFVELPALKLPGGGATAGLVTAEKQVRVLLRDLNGKACWDASILYSEPKGSRVTNNLNNAGAMPIDSAYGHFQIGSNFNSKMMPNSSVPLDPLVSTMVGMEISVPRHTLRHRPPNELPLAKDIAPDLDQLDDLLQYIGHTSPECLSGTTTNLNMPGPSPLGAPTEAQAISIILNQRTVEQEYVQRQNQNLLLQRERLPSFQGSVSGGVPDGASLSSLSFESYNTSVGSLSKNDVAFQYCRLLFSHLGLAGWERRQHTYLLKRTEKLLRELRNVDLQKCRETHKMAVIYVGGGQEDKNSILRNSCGSSTYEMFVSALGWEIELETHNGFLGGLPRQGCGATAPYYATPFLEVIFHVATRMPTDSPEAILTKTRHLGNDEVHIVWSEHHREYRRDILPTEFCDVLIVIYPLKSGLFRITVNRKPDVPWFGPLADESVISGACLASLVRATAINAGRAKRSSLPFYQQFYEERNRSLEAVSSRYKDSTTFEEFVARIYSPIPSTQSLGGNNAPLAAALIDHHRSSLKGWLQNSDTNMKDITQNQMMANSSQNSSASVDIPSPRPSRKLHPFKSMPKKSLQQGGTPPESPTLPGRKFK